MRNKSKSPELRRIDRLATLKNPGVRAVVARFASTPAATRAVAEELTYQTGNPEFAGMAAEVFTVRLKRMAGSL